MANHVTSPGDPRVTNLLTSDDNSAGVVDLEISSLHHNFTLVCEDAGESSGRNDHGCDSLFSSPAPDSRLPSVTECPDALVDAIVSGKSSLSMWIGVFHAALRPS
jgi:hypothetical protein